jgi:cobalt-zinc-cadmium efflux system outer membrane protein
MRIDPPFPTRRGRATAAAVAAVFSAMLGAPPSVVAAAELTLREAVERARRHNPELEAAEQAVLASDARVRQAGVLPNPELKAEVENIGGSGDFEGGEVAQTTLRLSQRLELGGKRPARQHLAEREYQVANAERTLRQAAIAARAALTFIDVLALQERLAIAGQLEQLADEASAAVATRVRAGAGAPAEILRADLARDEARLSRAQRERELETARVALAATWGGDGSEVGRVHGALAAIAPPPAAASLLAAIDDTPELRRWAEERTAREAAVAVEEARAIPDLIVGAGPRYFSDTDDAAVIVEMWMPLPLFDRNRGAIEAARAELSGADAERRAAAILLRAGVVRLHAALAAAHAQAIALRDELLPAAEAMHASASAAYRRGALSALDVLEAQRALFGLRDRQIEAAANYQRAAIELGRLLGAGRVETPLTTALAPHGADGSGRTP